MIGHNTGLQEYGGYLPLELPAQRGEYFQTTDRHTVIDLDCGRSALLYSLEVLNPSRVCIPLYYCPSVKRALVDAGYEVAYYEIDFDLLPKFDQLDLQKDDAIVLVNYFGLFDGSFAAQLPPQAKVVIDNCLAFFTPPVWKGNTINIYSCRKFFGVSDGAYAIGIDLPEPDYQVDVSSLRAAHLLTSLELGTNAGYKNSLENERALGSDCKRMSVLTHRILSSVDYDGIQRKRLANYLVLYNELSDLQRFNAPSRPSSPHSYPLLPEKGLRDELVRQRVYIARYWEDWIGTLKSKTPQWVYSNMMLCLPIDQRYDSNDMYKLAQIVRSVFERS